MTGLSLDAKTTRRLWLAAGLVLALLLAGSPGFGRSPAQETAAPRPIEDNLLKLLGIQASEESLDYVMNKTQFQLHTLLTEQRHPRTMTLSERVQKDAAAGLEMLFSVDEDITARLASLAASPRDLENLSAQMSAAFLEGRRVYFYGCGATGRLAKQMESTFWRPFWKRVKADRGIWAKLRDPLGSDIDSRLVGEMTGADRALISSLEGFEDLPLIGRLQLEDHGIKKGDVVVAVTEGGETSSVIGTVLAALEEWKRDETYSPQASRLRLYFVYNNPDDKLMPFARSRGVLQEPGITKINLTTGPQAITGSTRMQATTIETFVLGHVLEDALERALSKYLSGRELSRLGLGARRGIPARLGDFSEILREVRGAVPGLTPVTELEAATYAREHFSTYFARDGLITVFIDSTERSPTFRLYPLDTVTEPRRRCWIQVWTPAADAAAAWTAFLGRPFRGLAASFYRKPFEEEIEDPYLRTAALESLKKAGDDQRDLYDFAFSESNLRRRGPHPGDLGVAVALASDESGLPGKASPYRRFVDLFRSVGARPVVLSVGDRARKPSRILAEFLEDCGRGPNPALAVAVRVSGDDDPLAVNQNIALKMLLNAHSTAVMARLGKVVGNTMTNVSPSNLKLIGRATFLIQSHVNDVLARPDWVRRFGVRRPITYGEANAVLFDSIRFLKDKAREAGQTAEVALSIIRILESLRQGRGVPAEEAFGLVRSQGLSRYLQAAAASS
jgi:N-acetylmuramic acid 6-phosphate etherase